MISTAKILDREKTPHYWLSVLVSDLGAEPLLSQAHVFLRVLDVNDNAPQPSRPVYFASVQENVDAAGSVARVSATDADASSEGKLSFHMLESHRTHFQVDPSTGNGRPALFVHSFFSFFSPHTFVIKAPHQKALFLRWEGHMTFNLSPLTLKAAPGWYVERNSISPPPVQAERRFTRGLGPRDRASVSSVSRVNSISSVSSYTCCSRADLQSSPG